VKTHEAGPGGIGTTPAFREVTALAHEIRHDPDIDIIDIKYSGDISLEEILSVVEVASELIRRHDAYLVLSDFLDATISVDIERVLEISDKAGALGIPKEVRSAVIVPNDEFADGNLQVRLYEITAGTEGWPAKMFYSREQALQWLLY
jgi:hypothetical protein